MRNTTFWKQTLPPPSTLQKLSEDIHTLRRSNDDATPHAAGGKGPFGQLTSLGLYQMVDLGGRLRAELLATPLFSASSRRLHPSRVRVTSTDFPRTLQSVTGLLVGLFPDKDPAAEKMTIDARHTDIMIPDPQPRRTKEQEELEKELASAVTDTEREKNMRDLAVRVSEVLRRNVLGDGAEDVTFGVGEEKDGANNGVDEPLPWAQLAEITKCLKVRGMLPPEITAEDQDLISSHAAWRWFETLRHPRLARLAMHGMVEKMIDNAHEARTCAAAAVVGDDGAEEDGTADHPLLHIFSAHDSTLIGLMCAFRLEQPAQWPEYGSYLKMELWEESEGRHFVRFSLNGAVLRSYWGVGEGEDPVEMIDLERLIMLIDGQDYEKEMR
eukprot:CAMPEP_0172491680 /NCGR_PEP_ID=MMETSP1066-20121228/22548_1 /TAXON_ID=671091 /ORGANISM="Coscinodiscus wailesii, Strain CCMP2513" /LENGTH=382 /DNA_ID=CAMNT_0013260843 /DNA_START=317 /DNA_END=1465 /DNA_ORIENTATION=-